VVLDRQCAVEAGKEFPNLLSLPGDRLLVGKPVCSRSPRSTQPSIPSE